MVYENGNLDTLHPLACIQLEDLNEDFLHQNTIYTL